MYRILPGDLIGITGITIVAIFKKPVGIVPETIIFRRAGPTGVFPLRFGWKCKIHLVDFRLLCQFKTEIATVIPGNLFDRQAVPTKIGRIDFHDILVHFLGHFRFQHPESPG